MMKRLEEEVNNINNTQRIGNKSGNKYTIRNNNKMAGNKNRSSSSSNSSSNNIIIKNAKLKKVTSTISKILQTSSISTLILQAILIPTVLSIPQQIITTSNNNRIYQPTQLQAPKNLKAVKHSITESSIFLTWNEVPKAEYYRITLMPPAIGASGTGSGIKDKFTRIQGLQPNTEYTIRVSAVKENKEGIPAVTWQKTGLAPPDELYILDESLSDNSMTVNWVEVDGAETYFVDVSPSGGVTGYEGALQVNSVTLRGLTQNTQYTVSVRPKNWVGLGGSRSIRQTTKLGKPKMLKVIPETLSHNTIGVQFLPVPGASSYIVQAAPRTLFSESGLQPSASLDEQVIYDTYITLRDLQPDTQYTIRISAVNDAGASEYNEVTENTKSMCFARAMDFERERVQVVCPAGCAKFQDNIYGTREYTDDSLICTAAVHDGRLGVEMGGEITFVKRSGMPHYVGSVNNGIKSQDYGQWSKSFIFSLENPKNVALKHGTTISSEKMVLQWDKVLGADLYQITAELVSPTTTSEALQKLTKIDTTETEVTLSSLVPDSEYLITIQASNHIEVSSGSIFRQMTALPPVQKVELVEADEDTLKISWLMMAQAKSYLVSAHEQGQERAYAYDTVQTEVSLEGLRSGTEYIIEIRAVNQVGPGAITQIKSHTKLPKPSDLKYADISSTNFQVNWQEVEGAQYYRVEASPCCATISTDETFVSNSGRSAAKLSGLHSNRLYNVTIKAYNEIEDSKSLTLQVRTGISKPKGVEVFEVSEKKLKINWEGVDGANEYLVKILNKQLDFSEMKTVTDNFVEFEGLRAFTEFEISVQGRSEVNLALGDRSFISVSTRLPPPHDLLVRADSENLNSVKVGWTSVPMVTGYTVILSNLDGSNTQIQNSKYDKISVIKRIQTVTTQTSFTNLDSDTRYQVEVHANIGDSKGASSKEYFTVGLTAPTSLKIISGSIESDMVKLDWDMVEEASKYQVFYSKFETGEYSVKNVFDVKTEIDGLEAGSRYRSYVVSVDEDKNESSAASEVISFTTRLEEVSGFRVVGKNVGNGSVVLGWGDNSVGFEGDSRGEIENLGQDLNPKISEKISGFRLEQKSRNSLGDTSSNLIGVGTYARNVTMVTLYGLERNGIYEVTIQALSKSLGAEFSSREVKLVIQLETEETVKTPVKLKSGVNTEENENFHNRNINNAESDSPNSNSTKSRNSNSRSTVEVVTIDMTWVTVVIIVVALALVLLCVIVPCVVEFNQCASVQRVFSFSPADNIKNDSIVQDVLNNHINAVGVFRDENNLNATMSSRRTTQDHGSSSEMVKGSNKLKFAGIYCDSSDGSGSTGERGIISEESQVGLRSVRK